MTDINNKLRQLLENTGDMALKRRANEIVNNLELKKGDKILDVGCGDGYYLHLLSGLNIGLDLAGTDIDTNGLEKAKKNLGRDVVLKRGDLMNKIPFKDNYFDKAVISEVAEHLPNDVAGLSEVARVLKKGGILCLTVPNHNYPLFWDPVNWFLESLLGIHIKSGFFAGLWNQHIRLYEKEEIVKVVEKSGFVVNIAKSLTFWCLPFNHYIVNIVARLLASGKLSKSTASSLSKFSKNVKEKPLIIRIPFAIANLLDRLNDVYQPVDIGVSIFIKATKK